MKPLYGSERKRVILDVKRYESGKKAFTTSSYDVEADRFSVVLDLLIAVKERQDHGLCMRYSCNMGICGSCGMVINGKPRLACQTNVFALKTDRITTAPMEAHPVLRDLVCDFDEFFERHRSVKPWLIRKNPAEKYAAEREHVQTRSQVDWFLDFAYCIKCGLCLDACPVNNTNREFIGPQALSQALRYNADSRDEGEKERLDLIDGMDGVWGCEYAGACSEVCPKGVDPALTIQLLKLALMRYRFTGTVSRKKEAR